MPSASVSPAAPAAAAGQPSLSVADVGTWRWTRDDDRITWNEAHHRICGVPVGAFSGARPDFLACIHPDDRPAFEAAVAVARRDGTEYRCAMRLRRRDDGATRWVEACGRYARDARGPVAGDGYLIDVTARQVAEEALRRSERDLAEAQQIAGIGSWSCDLATGSAVCSRETYHIFGVDPATFVPTMESFLDVVHLEDRDRVADEMCAATAARAPRWEGEYRIVRPGGETRWISARMALTVGADGEIEALAGTMLDVTARTQLEQQLRQAQKMEAVGQLAGGIAHDFNNLLTVIGGSLELARGDLGAAHPVQPDLEAAADAADRARALVRQLRAVSRTQLVQAQLLALNDVVTGAEALLRRAIGEEIVLDVALSTSAGRVRADAGQLEQLLLNLAVNARDAMLTPRHGHRGRGGTLTIVTEEVALSPREAERWRPLAPGRYVRLTVRDTGHGMDAHTMAHLFEPFFTTKDVGEGTGLGLATAFGIVAQAGGAIRADSAPGRGATFTVLLPVAPDDAPRAAGADAPPAPYRGRGTVMLVEDEAPVRATARRMLERIGFTVLEARHGRDALRLWHEHADEVTALVTDLRMPEMGGRELAAALRARRPTLPIVFISGYADQASLTVRDARERVVEKPFTSGALLDAIREVLGAA